MLLILLFVLHLIYVYKVYDSYFKILYFKIESNRKFFL